MLKLLTPEQLYRPCALDHATLAENAHTPDPASIPGQQRALDAIDFALHIAHPGYNLFVMGPAGLGKHEIVKECLEAVAMQSGQARDWCYLNNFADPQHPALLSLPAGVGKTLAKQLDETLEQLGSTVQQAFASEAYLLGLRQLKKHDRSKRDAVTDELDEQAEALDIALVRTRNGFNLAPIKDGAIIGPKEFEQLPEREQKEIEHHIASLKEELSETLSQLPGWDRALGLAIEELDRTTLNACLEEQFAPLEQRFKEHSGVIEHLRHIKGHILANPQVIRSNDEANRSPGITGDPLGRYRINLLIDNSKTSGLPVITEDNPTYQNLLGRVEHSASMGTLFTDFTLIKPGSLHRANGGYLTLDADKVLSAPFAWQALKRALKSGEIRIEPLEAQLSLASTASLEPQPVPLDLKVVLIGDRTLYYLLKEYDDDFDKLFKVVADFSEHLPRDLDREQGFAQLIQRLIKRERLRPFQPSAICRVIEQSARRAAHAEKLSLHRDRLLDLLQQAAFWAERRGGEAVTDADVSKALEMQKQRMSQLEERLREQITENVLMIDTQGHQLGRINALSVLDLGEQSFGTVTRISATARLGNGEIIDIEREVDQGGPLHSKGVMILSAYLAKRYAKNQPLSLSASLVFEQTYGDIEGDSASAAELCALLSAVGDLPLNQALAITGSVNQHGEIQAIGGVNEKIEGFFSLCQVRDLSGEQGVIIPASNVKDLMLCEEVRQAVSDDRFRIYSVQHIEEAMELFCGLKPGTPDKDGVFPETGFNYRVQVRLLEWIALRRHYNNPE